MLFHLEELKMLTDDYLSMKELAVLCGSTQKRIGLALEKLGLWIVGGKSPTLKARREGYIGLREYPGHENYPLTVWHREKTLAALKTVGITLLPTFTADVAAQAADEDDDADSENEVEYGEAEDEGEDSDSEDEDEHWNDDHLRSWWEVEEDRQK
jgi:hypothetical protein